MKTKKNILIVDANEKRLINTCELFVLEGYRVWPADSCELAAVSVDVKEPDLILIDIKLKMKGVEFCKSIKEQDKLVNIPIVFIAFKNHSFCKIPCLDQGDVNFISKPFNLDELFKMVKNQLLSYSLL